MRIVQVAPDYYPVPPQKYGGIERIVYSLTEELVRRGHEVYLFAKKGSSSSANLIPYDYATSDYEAITQFVQANLPAGIDIIHDHTHASLIGKEQFQTPTVCSIYDTSSSGVRYPIYQSKRARTVASQEQAFYAYKGVDINEFTCTEQKEDYLLFLGVLNWHKGVLQAIEVAEKSGERLIIAGPIFNHDYFAQEVEPRINSTPTITFVGECSGEEKRSLLSNAKCLLFPASWEEPFGLVMAEAMACGTPVLAFPNGAVAEVLQEFPELICSTTDEMVNKLKNGIFPRAEELHKYVSKHFSTEAMADQYEEIYRQVIEVSKTAPDESPSFLQYVMNLLEAGDQDPALLLTYADQVKGLNHLTQAMLLYERILQSDKATATEKVVCCERLADINHHLGQLEKERSYSLQSFHYDTPRAELCCRLGNYFKQNNQFQQAIFWYNLATTLQPPADRSYFYSESHWTWFPHLELCVCYYYTGQYEKSYEHNERARSFNPHESSILANKKLLENILQISSGKTVKTKKTLENGMGGTFQMILHLPGYIEDNINQSGYWEQHLSKMICRFVKEDSLFLDIGANIGYHCLYTASEHPKTTCMAFEPHPVICEQLNTNLACNDFANMIVHNLAVGDKSGTIDFYMQSEQCYNRGLSGVKYYNDIGSDFNKIEVPVVALDDFLADKDQRRVSTIKIDTQGFEYNVLLGATRTIEKSQPIIFFEFHDYSVYHLENCFKLLPGYQIYKFQPFSGEIRRFDQPDPAYYEQDLLCVPASLASEFTALFPDLA